MSTTEILTNIESELEELRKTIQNLEFENAILRQKLGYPPNDTLDLNIKLKVMIDNAYVLDKNDYSTRGLIAKSYNILTRAGYEDIASLKGKNIADIARLRNTGPNVLATIIIICRHYGIEFDMNLNCSESFLRTKTQHISDVIEEIEKKISFKQ